MNVAFPLGPSERRAFVERALAEDVGSGDITSQATLDEYAQLSADIVAREPLIVAGLDLAEDVFRALDPHCEIKLQAKDGDQLAKGDKLIMLSGQARAILSAERSALNTLQHLSGIATLTLRYVDAIAGHKAKLLDTRKTIPGYRKLAKYACALGGAHNHRMGLFDAILIKDNHIAACGSLTQAVQSAKAAGHEQIEVECDTLEEMEEAIAAGATRVLLDNMSLEDLRRAVSLAQNRVTLEASGGVTLDTITDIAATGVDFISVGGALTLSAPAVDIGLDYRCQ